MEGVLAMILFVLVGQVSQVRIVPNKLDWHIDIYYI